MNTKNYTIPNIISTCRIASVPLLLYCVFTGRYHFFTWLLFAALLSDIVDGVIARVFHMETNLGAVLDALADMSIYIAAVTGIFVFKFNFIRALWPQMAIILAFYLTEKVSSFARYSRIFNAFHTYMSKITAYAQGAFVMSLFLFGFKSYLFYSAMALGILANIEEMILARLLPEYERDVKGLFWVLKRMKKPI